MRARAHPSQILVNAVDNGVREAAQTRIDVTLEAGQVGGQPPRVTITNDGPSVPVRMHATEGAWKS